jgi:hypothetical protein
MKRSDLESLSVDLVVSGQIVAGFCYRAAFARIKLITGSIFFLLSML